MTQRTPADHFELESLQQMVKTLSVGFDFVPDHIVITDPNGNIVYANHAAEVKTGFSFAAMFNKNPGDLWGGHMPDDFYHDMWQTIKTNKLPWVGEVKNRQKDSTEYWQELRIAPVLAGDGEISCFIAVEPDITERKVKEEKLRAVLLDIDRLSLRQALRAAELEAAVARLS